MPDLRLIGAREVLTVAQSQISAAILERDPVEQRREQVRIANRLREVADVLDDMGRLTQ